MDIYKWPINHHFSWFTTQTMTFFVMGQHPSTIWRYPFFVAASCQGRWIFPSHICRCITIHVYIYIYIRTNIMNYTRIYIRLVQDNIYLYIFIHSMYIPINKINIYIYMYIYIHINVHIHIQVYRRDESLRYYTIIRKTSH